MKLLVKVTLILGVCIGSTLFISGVFDYFYTRNAWERSISSQQKEFGVKVMDEIDHYLYERYLDIQAIGEDNIFEKIIEGEKVQKSEIKDHIDDVVTFSGPWETLFVVDTEGVIVASTDEDEVGNHISNEPNNYEIFKQLTLQKTKIYYSDLVTSDDSGKPTIMFAVALRNPHKPGRPTTGVVIGSLAWQSVQDIIQNINTSIELNLYTKDGKLIASNQLRNDLYMVDSENAAIIQEAHRQKQPIIIGNSFFENKSMEKLKIAIPSFGHLNFEGNGWVMLANSPVKTVFAPAREQSVRALQLYVIGFILALSSVLFFFKKHIVSPIILLSDFSNSISMGDFTKKINIVTNDELGMLASAFNTMSQKLQQTYTDLEIKVEKRTQELTKAKSSLEKAVAERTQELTKAKSSLEKAVAERTQELNQKLREVETVNKLMVNRELAMIHLKEENKQLKQKLGKDVV